MKFSKYPDEVVWEDATKLVKVCWNNEQNQLYLSVGNRWNDSLFYFQVNLNGFWHSICEFMREKDKENL